jgi:thiol:disulfide interchange protein DsbD
MLKPVSGYFLRAFLLSAAWMLASSLAQVPAGQPPVSARLLASKTALVPGQPFEVGLLLEMAPGWHTYWEYSGDAGLPTKIAWTLPAGFETGPIQWPAPHLMVEPGEIWTYGYGGKVLLITRVLPPADLAVGQTLTLRAKASWLACKDMCIPGSAEMELQIPVAATAAAANEELFSEFRSRIPSAGPPPFVLHWANNGSAWNLNIPNLPAGAKAGLFPLPLDGQSTGHPVAGGPGQFHVEMPGPFRGVLAVGEGADTKAWIVGSAAPAATSKQGLWMALFYGFLGGIILNLMPCVLPVISLKIFGFIKQAGESPRKIFAHGLAFVGGIFAWFLGLGILVVALKSGGSEVTWAFQFQNPWFNVAIGSVVFVFALNLFGVFELVLPGRASTALESASSSSGLAGSFFQGVFATLLATPCTAPFLGTALGFAFSQSAAVILAMFAAVATGMGFPYLLLTARPGWMKFLPRPGAWMERLKQLMGFPLLATLVWILGIVGGQRGTDGVFWLLCFLLCLAISCWLYGSFCGPLSKTRSRAVAIFLAFLFAGGGGWYFLGQQFALAGSREQGGIGWVPFSARELSALQASGKSVFLDFTADWCITCKFNERTAIDTPAVRQLLREKNVVPMRADWTNANPEITAALKNFGRVGVPFYVIYPAGRADEPIVLPELLTEAILVEALQKLP